MCCRLYKKLLGPPLFILFQLPLSSTLLLSLAHSQMWDEGEKSQLDTLWCLTQRQLCSMPNCLLLVCSSVSLWMQFIHLHKELCTATTICLFASVCICICVCVRVCERVFFADGINWIMLRNTGCVGFRTSTDYILLSHDISIIISV